MDTKLTLKLDKTIIDQAKQYAQDTQQSLSSLVEGYFRFLVTRGQRTRSELSPTVQDLSGIIQIDDDANIQELYTDYLLTKYHAR